MDSPYMPEPRYFKMGSGRETITIVCTRWDELEWYESKPEMYTPISRDEYNAIHYEWRAAETKVN